MFGSGLGFGAGMKSARVADQIDAEVKAGINVLTNTQMVADQLDFIETQLNQFAQLIGQAEPTVAMQFQNLVAQVNNVQGQVKNGIVQGIQSFRTIDSLTDKIQN